MNEPTIRSIVRRDLLIVFLTALIAGGGGFYVLLERSALDGAEEQARMMLSSAMAIRGYTTDHILPGMTAMHDHVFHEETVPFFATKTIFQSISASGIAYSYRESALNPTVPGDRAGPFEVDLIRQFREDTKLAERRGVIDGEGNRLFYLARPIRIDDKDCLICHDTPARAPQEMVAKYGSENGFGWKLGEIVGVQLVTVPVTREFRSSLQLVGILMGGLALIFAIAYFALTAAMNSAVVTPLAKLTEAADDASRSDSALPELPQTGAREIRTLGLAIQRLRISLAKALAQIGGGAKSNDE